ncbi:ribosomal-protein-alanine N-acetyltransferase [Roseovarius litorisediminis]|uniref:Ribosomal-protein-alanine N-acetyltransferase n=1 Tax=Roseovarius litorisediminis TaxID=1312363 RepID=A0A1Y5RPW9_9RHOB|nr:GNAT family N-acetyltransferase [Roseovarius litorisediminis]SLN22308.1 ribosomal-protein-alanine N-acetyltransferase [Roseovarius litorisediminis]
MTPEQMAHLHARAFASLGRAWSASEFADLLESPLCFGVGDARAFALGRVIGDDAELLTLATDPDHRRLGLARARLTAYETTAAERGATRTFLEVAQNNAAALALYLAAGYTETARRKNYYQTPDNSRVDALILQKQLGENASHIVRSEAKR